MPQIPNDPAGAPDGPDAPEVSSPGASPESAAASGRASPAQAAESFQGGAFQGGSFQILRPAVRDPWFARGALARGMASLEDPTGSSKREPDPIRGGSTPEQGARSASSDGAASASPGALPPHAHPPRREFGSLLLEGEASRPEIVREFGAGSARRAGTEFRASGRATKGGVPAPERSDPAQRDPSAQESRADLSAGDGLAEGDDA